MGRASPGRIIVVEGPSAVGKSTVARATAQALGGSLLAEAYARLRAGPSLAFTSERELVEIERTLLREERRRYREAVRGRSAGDLVLADTGFLGPFTYTAGLAALGLVSPEPFARLIRAERPGSASWGVPDLVVYLELDRAERRHRAATDATAHPPALDRRHEAVGRFERSYYRGLAKRELAGRLRFVRAEGAPGVVVRRIRRAIASSARQPARAPPTLEQLLAPLQRRVRAIEGSRSTPGSRHR